MWAAEAIAMVDIPLNGKVIPKGEKITITNGISEKYAVWTHVGVYDLPEEFVGDIVNILSES